MRCTPLFHGVDLCRDLALGTVGAQAVVAVAYLLLMAVGSLQLASRRLETMLQP